MIIAHEGFLFVLMLTISHSFKTMGLSFINTFQYVNGLLLTGSIISPGASRSIFTTSIALFSLGKIEIRAFFAVPISLFKYRGVLLSGFFLGVNRLGGLAHITLSSLAEIDISTSRFRAFPVSLSLIRGLGKASLDIGILIFVGCKLVEPLVEVSFRATMVRLSSASGFVVAMTSKTILLELLLGHLAFIKGSTSLLISWVVLIGDNIVIQIIIS